MSDAVRESRADGWKVRVRQRRLATKLAWMTAGLTAVVIGVVFVLVSGQIRSRTRSLFTGTLSDGQRAMLGLQQRHLEELLTGAAILSQTPTLLASIETVRLEGVDSASWRDHANTVERELRGVLAVLQDTQKELVVVVEDAGRVLAAATRGDAVPGRGTDLGSMPAVRRALDPSAPANVRELAVLRFGSAFYQVGVFPITQGGYTLGALLLGERIDARLLAEARGATSGEAIVVAGDEVVAATRGLVTGDLATLRAVTGDTAATVTLGGEEVMVAGLSLGLTQDGVPVRLWLVQPYESVVNAIITPLLLVFALAGVAVVIVAGAGGAVAARSVMRPFDRFVDYISGGSGSDLLQTRFDATGAPPEVATLNRAFDRLMDSLDSEHQQLERRSIELLAANAELREEVRERTRVEGELRESEAQLRQSQKMEAIGRLAGGIAHDFNNLLTVISGYSQLALSRADRAGLSADDLRQVVDAAERAARLTQQLLAFSRKQVLQPTVLDLGEVVQGVVPMLRPLIGAHIELHIRIDQELPRIHADRGQLEQVLINLVVNARDVMPVRGVLSIHVKKLRRTQGEAGRDAVALEVSDTGPGIPAAIRDRIFEPFFTTKEAGKGTGLGLSTVYGIVKQSGGTIDVVTDEAGTTFRITLPEAEALPLSDATWTMETQAPRGTETILLVEDEDDVRTLARRALEEHGYTVLAVGDPEEALHIAATASVDLLLTDVVMPHMSGPELVARAIGNSPRPAVVYMSGYADDTLQRFDFGAGRVFLRKPFSPFTLARTIRQALDASRRTPSSAHVPVR
jgi:signal transduction histidine kinase/CheY-like chemotaxis protein